MSRRYIALGTNTGVVYIFHRDSLQYIDFMTTEKVTNFDIKPICILHHIYFQRFMWLMTIVFFTSAYFKVFFGVFFSVSATKDM